MTTVSNQRRDYYRHRHVTLPRAMVIAADGRHIGIIPAVTD